MKSIKYLMLAAVSAFMLTSCGEKEVDGPWEIVTQDQAQVQILYETPVAAAAANYVYKVELAGKTYENNGAALLNTYNGIPSGSTGLYYTIPAGTQNLTLYLKGDKKVYDKNFTVEGGKKYQIFVCEYDKDPVVIETPKIPAPATTETAEYACVRFINFMFEDANTRYAGKVQLRLQDPTTKEYYNVGDPIGFGEATEWFMPEVHKTVFNSQGYQRRDLDLQVVDTDGKTLVNLEYINSSDKNVAHFTDYWTLYIGRGYNWILHGTRGEKTAPVSISQWTLR